MRARFLAAFLSATLVAGALAPAAAQSAKRSERSVKPPPVTRPDRTRNLDFLFGALKAAPDDVTAKAIEERIWTLWTASQSDTANLLMTRVKTAIEAKDLDLAVKLLDAIVKVKPDYVEAWNRRATIFYMKKDYGRALSDIRQVLKREPRHFGALAGFGLILQDIGDDKQALEVYRRALALYPRMERIPDLVKSLQEKVEGATSSGVRAVRSSIADGVRTDICDAEHIRCTRRAERNAGHDNDALPGFGETFLEGNAARAVDHVILVMRILSDDTVHSPYHREPPSGWYVGRQRNNRRPRSFARHPQSGRTGRCPADDSCQIERIGNLARSVCDCVGAGRFRFSALGGDDIPIKRVAFDLLRNAVHCCDRLQGKLSSRRFR